MSEFHFLVVLINLKDEKGLKKNKNTLECHIFPFLCLGILSCAQWQPTPQSGYKYGQKAPALWPKI